MLTAAEITSWFAPSVTVLMGSHIKSLQLGPAELFWKVLSAYVSRGKMRCDLDQHKELGAASTLQEEFSWQNHPVTCMTLFVLGGF